MFGAAGVRAQISPGPLARPHATLEGSRNCSQCHGGRAEPTTQRCLACHREIAWLQQQGQGYHARRDARGACSSCHPDHAGRDFELIQWPAGAPERFDHARGTGYALEGSHSTAKCSACHRSELRTSPAAKLSPRETTVGWIGLETDCTSCHSDPHRGKLEGACTRCHDTREWKDAPGFDHARTDYPLTGKHTDVTCAKCHLAARLRPSTDSAGRPVSVFRPVPFKDCSSCHTDPHRGRLTGSCSACHVTSSFRKIDRNAFDHDRTRYPLRGQHASATCTSCHVGFPSTGMRPAFATCGSCHRDVHDGQATVAGKTVDCAACHRVEGFTPATYTVEQHRATGFPLLGRHARVACTSCHTARASASRSEPTARPDAKSRAPYASTAKVIEMRPRFQACADCHNDAHGGQLASRPDRGACNACHSVDGWKPSTFGLTAHAASRLPLDGTHAAVPCGACHGPERPGLRPLPTTVASGTARVVVRPPEIECAQCHTDPHVWQKKWAAVPTCTACHSTRVFRPTSMNAADHASTGYALEGSHRAVSCVGCHEAVSRPRSRSTLIAATPRLAPLSLGASASTCVGCHSDPHGGQFQKLGGGACDRCHTMTAFAPASRFDHTRDARFPLSGAHARASCVACHRQPTGAKPGAPLTYAGLSARCESCHTGAPARPRGGE